MNSAELDAQIEMARTQLLAFEAPVVQVPAVQDSWWSVTNAMTISVAVLIFGVFVLLLATYLIKVGKSSESVLRIFGTVLIIVISVFLVVAGYTSNQIAPVMGLLGTVAGYLLGKEGAGNAPQQNKSSPDA